VSELPEVLVNRLEHYFSTYKMRPGGQSQMSIESIFDRDYALRVVAAAIEDYDETFGG
jgi:inorganic pyrophosphatase